MTDTGTPQDAQGGPAPGQQDPTPITPGGPWQTGSRVEQLAVWMQALRSSYTDAALERSAIAGGFTADEFQQARVLADTRQRQQEAMGPVRSRASWIVLFAYGLVWVLFAIPYLLLPSSYGAGPLAQGVLTVTLLLGLLLSWLVMRALHPDPTRVGRALAILLIVPVIVLLGIGGLCLPFVSISGQG